MKTLSSFLFVVWHLMQAVTAMDTVESTPDHISGQLLACIGDTISLTCSRTEGSSGVTRWVVTSPTISCDSVITHAAPVSIEPCGLFIFQNITEIPSAEILSSTAVATVNGSVSGAVIQCFNSRFPRFSAQIGPNITLCVPDELLPPVNVEVELMANGTVEIVWNRPPDICEARNITYIVSLIPTDGNSVDEGIELPVITNETSIMFDLTPGREYSAFLRANNHDCSISSDVVTKNFTARQDAVMTTDPPITLGTTEKSTTQAAQTSTGLSLSTIIIIIVVIVAVTIILLIVAVVILYFFYWRPKSLLKRTSMTDGNVELHIKSSEVDALVYDDPSPKSVSHVEAASGDLYAQPDKTDKNNADTQGSYQDPNSIKHKQAPTGDEYAMPQTGKKGKNQGSSVDPVNANIPALYATVDTSKKNQLTYAQLDVGSGSGAQPVPQSTSYATVIN